MTSSDDRLLQNGYDPQSVTGSGEYVSYIYSVLLKYDIHKCAEQLLPDNVLLN